MSKRDILKSVSVFKPLIFLVFPAIFLFFALPFNRTHFGNDPEYAYLMNGINIGMLKPVGHTDNPGTTVQIYSAVVLRCAYLVQPDKSDGFQTYMLRNGDRYIELERKGLIVINSLVMLLLGMISWLMLRNVWLSLLLQIMPFTSANLTEHVFTKVSPEPVLLMATAALVLLILGFYYSQKRDGRQYALYFAMVFGFGLATKATFLPLIFVPLLLLDSKILRKRFLLLIIPFFILFTLPAVPQYPHMAKWFLMLTAHTGSYGEGGLGVIKPLQYVRSLFLIFVNNPVLTLTLMVSVLIICSSLFRSSFKSDFINDLKFRIITVLSVAQLTGVFMIAKHYHANHYLVPELCLVATSWVFIYFYLNEELSLKFRKAVALFPVILLMIAAGFVIMTKGYLQKANQGYNHSNQDFTRMMNLLTTEYKDYTLAYYYPTSINSYSALRWGNVYSLFNHTEALKTLYPDGYFFDTRTNYFSLWETPVADVTMSKIAQGKLLIIGGPFDEKERLKIAESGLKLIKVYQGITQIIYKVDFTVDPGSQLK